MMKNILFFLLLFCWSTTWAQVEFVQQGRVIADGSIITVTEVNEEYRAMDSEVLVKNNGSEAVFATLKVTLLKPVVGGFIGFCGFGVDVCAPVTTTAERSTTIESGTSVDPSVQLQAPKDDVDASIQYELLVDGTSKIITINFLRGKYVDGKSSQNILWDQSIPYMTVGDKLKLNATATSGLKVTYSSSDPSKIKVGENGEIEALSYAENVIITAYQDGNDNYKAASPILKNTKVIKKMAGINISNCIQTYDGTTKQVDIVTEPLELPYKVRYLQGTFEVTETKNADVYYVEVTIDSEAYEATANSWLIINKAPQIIVWNQDDIIEVGNEIELVADNTTSSFDIDFQSEDPTVAEVVKRDGKNYLIGKSSGSVRIMAHLSGDSNYEEAAEVRTFVVKAPSNNNEFIRIDGISYYPTLIQDILTIEGIVNGDVIQLMDVMGNVVYKKQVVLSDNNVEKMTMSNLNGGIYVLTLVRGNQQNSYKVIKR